jgi:hypothetical protein
MSKHDRKVPMVAVARWLCLALSLALAGCVSKPAPPPLFAADPAESGTPLGGESLAHRSELLRRAHRDLVRFRDTLETIQLRRDRDGKVLFKEFLEHYMEDHLDGLLVADWQSGHPELLGLDANIRLMQAELFMLLGDRASMSEVVETIETRYAGRMQMLVDYPAGQQNELEEALRILSRRKWWG